MLSKTSIELLLDMVENRLSDESVYEDNDLNSLYMCRQELIELTAAQDSKSLKMLLKVVKKVSQRRLKKSSFQEPFGLKKKNVA